MIILIPAYEPDAALVSLVVAIRSARPDQHILIVDDGSGSEYAAIFEAAADAGASVIGHRVNRGKGAALKTGFAHIADCYPGEDVVCADCDGQHALADIMAVAEALRAAGSEQAIVLGARAFAGEVPARSRFGNDLTRAVFKLSTGIRLADTQTGLRGYGADLLPWLQSVPGDRFDYELQVLLDADREGIALREVPIETIYFAGNESSHFHPIVDSIRVYVPFVKYSASSLGAFAVDAALFFGLMAATGNLALSVVVARLVSATTNFVTNRRLVFASAGPNRRGRAASAGRYAPLAAVLLVANYVLLHALGALGFPLVAAKLATEVTLFLCSYNVQRRYVFSRPNRSAPSPASEPQAAA